MSDTATKKPRRLPVEDPMLVRYSPHHEFPLSVVSSVALHALAFGLLALLGVIAALALFGGDTKPVPVDAVALAEPAGGGGGNPDGAGKAAGDGALAPSADDAPLPDPNERYDVSATPREKLQEVRQEAKALPEFKDEVGQRLIEEGGAAVDKILRLKTDVRQKLNEGLAAGKGEGGSGRGGGAGSGTGSGEGGGGGPGKGTAKRADRVLRWTLIFNTRDGRDYARQLEAFGAILAIPDPRSDGYLVIRDLKQPQAKPEDIAQIHRIYWIDDKPASVRSLSSALNVPPPPHFVVFFPADFEQKLLALELGYRNKQEDEIAETRFEVRRRGDTYEPYVVSQRLIGQ